MKLRHKTILLVGASSGIGRCVALQLAQQDNRLILVARRQAELQQLAQEVEALGSRAQVIVCDATCEEDAARAVAEAIRHHGSIDVALLNVGDGPAFNMATTNATDIRHNMNINYLSLVNFLVPLIAHMKTRQQGLIAHTNSLAGFLGPANAGALFCGKSRRPHINGYLPPGTEKRQHSFCVFISRLCCDRTCGQRRHSLTAGNF